MSDWFWMSSFVMINFNAFILACLLIMGKIGLMISLGVYNEVRKKITHNGELLN